MYHGIHYGEYLDTPYCRVSLDNVRMKFLYKYKNYDFEKFRAVESVDLYSMKVDRLFFENCDTKWSYCDFFKIGNYTRTCTISGIDPFLGDWSCALMIGRYTFDSSCKQVAPEIVLDFNPNKVPVDISSRIIQLLRDGALSVSITRYDVAFDFPIPRDHITLIPNDRQGYKLFRDVQKGVTEYQGERSNHNAMKLYDKTRESSLDVPVTRCEITIDGKYTDSIQPLFPALVVLGDLQMDIGFSDLPFPVVACLVHPDLIPSLKQSCDRKTWKKYKQMIETHGQRRLTPGDWKDIDRHIRSQLFRMQEVVM